MASPSMPAALLGAVLALAAPASPQCSTQPLAALAATSAGDQFGYAVALQGDELFVSATGFPYAGEPFGRVQVFRAAGGTWQLAQTLVPFDGDLGYSFGTALDVDGDRLAVGASAAFVGDNLPGAVYVFERAGDAWQPAGKLFSEDQDGLQGFGSSVDLHGDRLAVGARFDGDDLEGAAYVFERAGSVWEQAAKLKPRGLLLFDGFGSDVAIEGDWMAAGKPGDTSSFSEGGRVHVYHRDAAGAWLPTQVLESTATTGGDYLGMKLEMEGGTLLASAHLESFGPPSFASGAVYDFELDGSAWVLGQKLVAGDPDDVWGFGASLALRGERVAIGSGTTSALGDEPGAVHVFDRVAGEWTRVGTVDAPATLGDAASFGGTAAVEGSRLAVGCDRDDGLGLNAGAAFAFELGLLHETFGEGVAGQGDLVPELLGVTCGAPGSQTLHLTVAHGLGGALGALFAGAEVGSLPFADGLLYPSAPWRIYPHVLGGLPGATGAGFAQLAGDVPTDLTATQAVVQVIYVDAAAVGGFARSRGLVLAFP